MPNKIFYVCIFMEHIKSRLINMQNRIHKLHAGCGLTDYSNMVSKQKCIIITYKEYEEINYLLNLTITYCVGLLCCFCHYGATFQVVTRVTHSFLFL